MELPSAQAAPRGGILRNMAAYLHEAQISACRADIGHPMLRMMLGSDSSMLWVKLRGKPASRRSSLPFSQSEPGARSRGLGLGAMEVCEPQS